ncbi:hypothetical protein AMTRI_Chr02g211890 [Amborella trichopoda]
MWGDFWKAPEAHRAWRSAPCTPEKEVIQKAQERQEPYHALHKVPAGDSPYVKAKHVQLVDKDPNRAIALFWSAINHGDRVDSALKDMAIVMKQVNRAEEAIEAIKSFRHLCSDQAQESLDNVLLDLHKRCGRLDDQIELLKYKLKMIKDGVAFSGKKTKIARSQGKKFHVSIEQEEARLLGNLGWAYMQQGKFAEAESEYRKALAIEPDDNKKCNLAICLMQKERIAEAKTLLTTVKPTSMHSPGSESHLKSYERACEMIAEIESQSSNPKSKGGKAMKEAVHSLSAFLNGNWINPTFHTNGNVLKPHTQDRMGLPVTATRESFKIGPQCIKGLDNEYGFLDPSKLVGVVEEESFGDENLNSNVAKFTLPRPPRRFPLGFTEKQLFKGEQESSRERMEVIKFNSPVCRGPLQIRGQDHIGSAITTTKESFEMSPQYINNTQIYHQRSFDNEYGFSVPNKLVREIEEEEIFGDENLNSNIPTYTPPHRGRSPPGFHRKQLFKGELESLRERTEAVKINSPAHYGPTQTGENFGKVPPLNYKWVSNPANHEAESERRRWGARRSLSFENQAEASHFKLPETKEFEDSLMEQVVKESRIDARNTMYKSDEVIRKPYNGDIQCMQQAVKEAMVMDGSIERGTIKPKSRLVIFQEMTLPENPRV